MFVIFCACCSDYCILLVIATLTAACACCCCCCCSQMHVVLLVAVVAFVAHGRLHVACTFSCSSWAIQKRFAAADPPRSLRATAYILKKTIVVFLHFFHIHHTHAHTYPDDGANCVAVAKTKRLPGQTAAQTYIPSLPHRKQMF